MIRHRLSVIQTLSPVLQSIFPLKQTFRSTQMSRIEARPASRSTIVSSVYPGLSASRNRLSEMRQFENSWPALAGPLAPTRMPVAPFMRGPPGGKFISFPLKERSPSGQNTFEYITGGGWSEASTRFRSKTRPRPCW